jgi:hypothetical protein
MPRQRTAVPAVVPSPPHDVIKCLKQWSASRRANVLRGIEHWMAKLHPEWGVDTLLTHPFSAAVMALVVLKNISPDRRAQCEQIIFQLEQIIDTDAELAAAVDGICAAAMNARKAGVLRPHAATSPASRAARTRRRAVRS